MIRSDDSVMNCDNFIRASPVLVPSRSRQIDREDAALASNVTYAEGALVRFHGAAADREPESDTTSVAAPLFEGPKQLFGLAVGETAALVRDFDQDSITCGASC